MIPTETRQSDIALRRLSRSRLRLSGLTTSSVSLYGSKIVFPFAWIFASIMAILRQEVYFGDRYMPPVPVVLQRPLTLGGNDRTILITLLLHPVPISYGDQVPVYI